LSNTAKTLKNGKCYFFSLSQVSSLHTYFCNFLFADASDELKVEGWVSKKTGDRPERAQISCVATMGSALLNQYHVPTRDSCDLRMSAALCAVRTQAYIYIGARKVGVDPAKGDGVTKLA